MGYELENLKNLYGVGSESLSYGGAETPVPSDSGATPPASGGSGGGAQTPSSYDDALAAQKAKLGAYYYKQAYGDEGYDYKLKQDEGKPFEWTGIPSGRQLSVQNQYAGGTQRTEAIQNAWKQYNDQLNAWQANNPKDQWKAPSSSPSSTPNYNVDEMAKYKEDQRLYDDYTRAYKERLFNTDMYAPAQNRQILNSPVYSGADPRLAPNPQYTISNQQRDTSQQLPNLVSKYALGAPPVTTPEQPQQPSGGGKGLFVGTYDQALAKHRAAAAAHGAYYNRAHGGVIALHKKYAEGGEVKTHYPDGGGVDLSTDDEDKTDDTAVVAPTAYDALLAKYQDVDPETLTAARADYRAKQQAMIDKLAKYETEQKALQPDKSEMYFRLAQAFLTPGKTGSFGEGLANAGGVMADYMKEQRAEQRANAANLLNLGLKQQELLTGMSQEDLKALEAQQAKTEAARQAIELAKIKASGTSSAATVYEKQAIAEGLTKGTPEFVARIKELWSEAHQPSAPAQPAPTLATIIDPTDPSKALVVNARTYQGGGANASGVIGTANKDSVTANMSSKDIQELNASYPNLKAANDAAIAEIDKQLRAIDQLENHSGLDYITGKLAGRVDVGALTDDGSDALALYDTVTGKALTQALSAARANSPSGASGYGNLTASEAKTLRDSQATLGRSQRTDTFKENLQTYKADLQASKNALVNKFNETYAYRGTQPAAGGTGTGANVAPSRPSTVPAGAKYSPSQKKWFWQDASGAWKSN